MRKRPLLGELLVELGRVSAQDIERALAYQQERGGFLGDALIQLGVLTPNELSWSLASQHSMPFVHLRPESIDPVLAAHVPEAWAREHLVLPVLRTGDALTVVMSDPADMERAEEVRRMTGAAQVDAALSEPDHVLDLIEAVYRNAIGPAITVREMIAEALGQGASRVGVSARRGRAVGWYRVNETVRRTLGSSWESELQEIIHPPPGPAPDDGRTRSWSGTLRDPAGDRAVECRALGSGTELEWAAEVLGRVPFDVTAARVDSHARALARRALDAGGTVVRVIRTRDGAPDDETYEGATALLPGLLTGRTLRAVHISDRRVGMPPGVLTLAASGALADDLAEISAFQAEAVTVAVDHLPASDAEALRTAAPIAILFVRGGGGESVEGAIDLSLKDADGLLWTHEGAADAED